MSSLSFVKLAAGLHQDMLGGALCLFSSAPGSSTSRRGGLCDRNNTELIAQLGLQPVK